MSVSRVLARLPDLEGMVKSQVGVNLTLGSLKHIKLMEHFGIKKYLRKAGTIKWLTWHIKNLPLKWVSMTHLNLTRFRFIVRRCRNFGWLLKAMGTINHPSTCGLA